MKLALFDLDLTLLPIDSGDAWKYFLVRMGGLDEEEFGARIRAFAASYSEGRMDNEAYLNFEMDLLTRFPRPQLEDLRTQFLHEHVLPNVRPQAVDLIEDHLHNGYTAVMATGTNAFVTRPIAAAFGLEHLLAVEPEEIDGKFTGRHVGMHTYGEGKVRAVESFMAARGKALQDCDDSVFYSDSINDLPLLERVRRPVATNPDDRLRAVAAERGWTTLELFAPALAR